MIRIFLSAAIGMTVLAVPFAQAEDIKSLMQRYQEQGIKSPAPPDTIPYSYVVTADIKSGEDDESEDVVARYRMNPQAGPGARITILDPNMEDLPKEIRNEIDRLNNDASADDLMEDFWCTKDNDDDRISPDEFTVVRETDTEAVITPSNDALRDMMKVDNGEGEEDMPKKLAKRLTAELTLAKPDLTLKHMKVWLTKPTTIKIVAKIKQMNIEQSCEIAPNGIPYVSERKTRVSGKALGSSFSENMVITVSDLQPL